MSRVDSSSIELFLSGLARHAKPYRNDDTGILCLSLPERLPTQIRDDSLLHISKEGDTCLSLAVAYFKDALEPPTEMAVLIANFQDPPIVDMSIPIEPGRVVQIPSMGYRQEVYEGDTLTETPRM